MNKKRIIPLLALAALAFVLAACSQSDELDTGASAPVIITASSSWLTDGGTRAVKTGFAVGDVITLTYNSTPYYYKLTTQGWVTTDDELRILLTTNNPKASGTCKDEFENELAAPAASFYVTATSTGEKAWGISLEFVYSNTVGAIDLTLLKPDLSPLTVFDNVTITIDGIAEPKTFTKAQTDGGIVLPAGKAITKIEVDTNNDTSAYEYEATLIAGNKVVARKRHALTVVLTQQ